MGELTLLNGDAVLRNEPDTAVRYRPMNEKVIVRKITADRSKGGLFLPNNYVKDLWEGEVLMLGPGRWGEKNERLPINLKVGDQVLFLHQAALPIDPQEPDVLLVDEDNVLGVRIQ